MWYVTKDDQTIGPIDIDTLQAHWEDIARGAYPLVWKPGMSCWAPVAEVPELAHLAARKTDLPESTATMIENLPEIGWHPWAGSALAALGSAESLPVAAAKPVDGSPQIVATSSVVRDLFGRRSRTGTLPPTPPKRQTTDPFGGKPVSWSHAALRMVNASWFGTNFWLLAGMFVVVMVCLVSLMFLLPSRPAIASADSVTYDTVPPAVPRAALSLRTPAPDSGFLRRAQPLAQTPAIPAPLPAVLGDQDAVAPSPPTGPADLDPGARPTPVPAPTPNVAAKDSLDELVEAAPLNKTGAGMPSLSSLTRSDILTSVGKQAATLSGCLSSAREAGELASGRTTFVLDWTINPDGSISRPRVAGPTQVLGTSLPGCFATHMQNWMFPASPQGAPITNFPMPVTLP